MFPWLRYITSPRFVMYLHLIPSLQKVSTYMACYSHTAPPSNVSAVVKAIAGGSCTAGKLSTCARRVPGSAELLANHFCARIKAVRSSTVGFAQIIARLSLDSLSRLGKGPDIFVFHFWYDDKYCTCLLQFPTGVSKLKEGERIWQTCYRASIPSSIFFFAPSYAQRWAPPTFRG